MKHVTRARLGVILISALLGATGCSPATEANIVASDIKADETVVFFRTAGWQDPADDAWHVPIHGWIYEPEDSTVRLTALRQILKSKFELPVGAEHESNFSRRANLLIADNERGKRIVIEIAGREHTLQPSVENGQFSDTLVISAADAEQYAGNGYLRYTAVTQANENRTFEGEVRLVPAEGLSVVSDIDDTVKISNVTDRKRLMEQTFLQDFVAAPGMAALYGDWSARDVSFHYVSSSPWQLYSPLLEFLDGAGFPWATFSLKAVRFRDATLFDLFKKGTETKPPAIEAILDRYPNRRFVLVGDSGEQDPEVYAELLRKRREQILGVCIRNVTRENSDGERFSAVFEGLDRSRWQLFEDPKGLDCF